MLIIHYSFFVNRDISFGFLDGDLIAVLYMVADPARDILGRRIDVQHLVDILMIEGVLYDFLDVGEIGHHAILIQLLRLAIDDNDPVMAVQVLALAFESLFFFLRNTSFHHFIIPPLTIIDCFILNSGLRQRFFAFATRTAHTAVMLSAFIATPGLRVIQIQLLAFRRYLRFR